MSKDVTNNSITSTGGGWGDDDQWDDFDDTVPPAPIVAKTTGSQMKLGGVKTKEQEEDFWAKMGSSYTSGVKEKTPPPPVPAGLFGNEKTDEWNDWGNNDDVIGLGGQHAINKTPQGLTMIVAKIV